METANWIQVVTDENTGKRVLAFTGMSGLYVNPADLGESDALLELQDY